MRQEHALAAGVETQTRDTIKMYTGVRWLINTQRHTDTVTDDGDETAGVALMTYVQCLKHIHNIRAQN